MSLPIANLIEPEYLARMGPLAPLIADPHVTEVIVVAGHDVYVEVQGRLLLTPITFASHQEALSLIQYIAESVGRRIDAQSPICDARLPDGSRVHAAIPPVAIDGPQLNIRKFQRGPLEMQDLIRLGSCSESAFGFLKACVMARANVLVSGGTSSGKTTLLNVLSGSIPGDERIVTIEDAAELQLRQRHVARLESHPIGGDGTPEITLRDLVISSLRMRPDRLIVGEVRGAEALDMLQAMNTGHDGSMTTIHANRARDALARIETLVMMSGYDFVPKSIRAQIASAFNVVIHLERMRDGSRKVVQISEVTGMDEDVISMQDIIRFTRTGIDSEGRVLAGLGRPVCGPEFLIASQTWDSRCHLSLPESSRHTSRGRSDNEALAGSYRLERASSYRSLGRLGRKYHAIGAMSRCKVGLLGPTLQAVAGARDPR